MESRPQQTEFREDLLSSSDSEEDSELVKLRQEKFKVFARYLNENPRFAKAEDLLNQETDDVLIFAMKKRICNRFSTRFNERIEVDLFEAHTCLLNIQKICPGHVRIPIMYEAFQLKVDETKVLPHTPVTDMSPLQAIQPQKKVTFVNDAV